MYTGFINCALFKQILGLNCL